MTEFVGFPKIARLSRDCIVTEKIDGTNGQILIDVDTHPGEIRFLVGSKSRWIDPEHDNFGFAQWAYEHKEELIQGLGPGRHFGEWWGQGIQRNYGLKEKRFSLFNVSRWINSESERANDKQFVKPVCCHIVPIITIGKFDVLDFGHIMARFLFEGSHAAPGFMKPEGIVIFHVAGNFGLKKTFEKDEEGKGYGNV